MVLIFLLLTNVKIHCRSLGKNSYLQFNIYIIHLQFTLYLIFTKFLLIFFYFSEIVGRVEQIFATKAFSNELNLFKFVVSNDHDDRVQIIAWNNEIPRVEPIIKNNSVNFDI